MRASPLRPAASPQPAAAAQPSPRAVFRARCWSAASRSPVRDPRAAAVAALILAAALGGCGKSLPSEGQGRGAGVTTVASAGTIAASGVATKNTTRLGGADASADAAAVALAVYPALTPATRPDAVVPVDKRDWPAALAAAALAAAPLRAPLLYSEGETLPAISTQALAALRPSGAQALGGAQVIEIGTSAAPAGYSVRSLTGGEPAVLAAQIERLVAVLQKGPPRRVIVVSADGPPPFAMPAAGLAAESGAPILPVDRVGIPRATRSVLAHLRHPTIYAVGPPAALPHAVIAELAHFGPVRRIAGHAAGALGGAPGEAADEGPLANAIAVARYIDGSFGWGVEQPGHGLVFASASRPLDAPAAASLSASGDYGPLLLLEGPGTVPLALANYLRDIQPGYDAPEYPPVRGVYNHGWLIGDGRAIAATTQAELDALLEISPQSAAGALTSSSTTTTTAAARALSP